MSQAKKKRFAQCGIVGEELTLVGVYNSGGLIM